MNCIGCMTKACKTEGKDCAGMMKMPVWKFLLATVAGKVIRFTVFGVLGQTLFGK